jgi:hypothetical protein
MPTKAKTDQAAPVKAGPHRALAEPLARYSAGVVRWDAAAYRKLLELRKDAYAAAVEVMSIDPAIRQWAERMTLRFGHSVKVHHNTLPWVQALLVVRYGEAVEHWPGATTVADYGRAMDWESGKAIPEPVRVAHTLKLEG